MNGSASSSVRSLLFEVAIVRPLMSQSVMFEQLSIPETMSCPFFIVVEIWLVDTEVDSTEPKKLSWRYQYLAESDFAIYYWCFDLKVISLHSET